jgi:uncharacterized protein
LIDELKQGLVALYGERLDLLYLFGSRARGDQEPDSDVDILIVLDDIGHYYGELVWTSELVASLSLRYEVNISRTFLSADEWQSGESPFVLTAREDAVAA